MIKTAIITLVGAGVLGTGAQTFTPQSLHMTAGAIVIGLDADGFQVESAENPDFAVTLKTKGERQFSLHF